MKGTITNQFKSWFRNYQKWFFNTPERALDRAYKAALKIKAIEDDHFNGQKVSPELTDYGSSVISYFQSEINQHLNTIKLALVEFESSNSIFTLSKANLELEKLPINGDNYDQSERGTIILEKLKFIDEIVNKYQKKNVALVKVSQSEERISINKSRDRLQNPQPLKPTGKMTMVSDKTEALPRSILRTFGKIKQEIDPNSEEIEEQVVDKFRKSRNKTARSIKFLLILVIVPLLVHQLAKIAITPFIENNFFTENPKITWFQPIKIEPKETTETELDFSLASIEQKLFINKDLQEEAWEELEKFENNLKLKTLMGIIPPLSEEVKENLIKEKTSEIVANFRHRSNDALGNVFADFCSLITFIIILFVSRDDISILKSFIDEIVYGLSDSAKAFLIILFTDIFVGYHSPHGWEIILEGLARHLGIPENRDFNFLFIATFPVILDTVLKYWIFRYLNRISPSAVATYRNMNE